MKTGSFLKGMGLGLAVGAAAGMCAAAPTRKKGSKTIAGRAMKALGRAIDSAADDMGL